MPTKWVIKETLTPNKEQIAAAGSELVAKLLLQRGVSSPTKIKQFLEPSTIVPVSPYAYNDMQKAVGRIKTAIENGENILIYGDFDADGVTSTAVMHKTLTKLGANVLHYIPDRQMENHGLNKSVLLTKISKEQIKLIITVDCGISNCSEISLVNVHGVDVIVTDHHEAQEELPKAYAILDAKAQGALKEDLPFEDIDSLTMMAGVGAAFKLACALLTEYNQIDFTQELLPLVAVGTVADVMPLLNENRLFVALGMQLILEGKNQGLTELLTLSGISVKQPLTAEKLAFNIAPRINAVGRLDSAEIAFRLLVSNNEHEISLCANSMDNFNKLRQELSDKTYLEAVEYIESSHSDDDSVVVAYNKDWHVGIVGLVASKIVEKYNKPVFMFTDSPDGKMLRASARSIEDVNIFNALEINSDMFEAFGGHAAAAGISIDKSKFGLDVFKQRINETVFEMTGGKKSEPVLHVDMEIKLSDLSIDLINNLNKLEPYGESNPIPIFAVKDLKLQSERTIGSENNHLKFVCIDKNSNTVDCVFWKHSSLYIPLKSELDIAFVPKINEYNGIKSLQLDIRDYLSDNIKTPTEECALKVIDHRKKTDIFEQMIEYVKSANGSISLFAEDKAIASCINNAMGVEHFAVTRKTSKKSEQLMLFDYPPSKILIKELLNATSPKIIHFMPCPQKHYDVDDVISKISGMMKFAANKYNGVANLTDISVALAITDELTTLLVRLINRVGMIKVKKFERGNISFDFLHPVAIETIRGHEVYEQCRMELFKIRNFREEITQHSNLKEFIKSL